MYKDIQRKEQTTMAAFSINEINEAKEYIRLAATLLDADWSFFQDESIASDLDHLAWVATLMDSKGVGGTDSVWLNQETFLGFKADGAEFIVDFVLYQEGLLVLDPA